MKVQNLLVVAGLASGLAAAFALTACEQKDNPLKTAANAANNAATKATDAAKSATDAAANAGSKAVDAAKDTATAATDAVKDGAKAATDVAKDAAGAAGDMASKAMEAGKTWLTDTVEKQWPGMKTQLEDASKKVASIKDAATKTKAEGLVKDLQGQIPAIEKLVGDLKGAGTDKFAGLFDQAKKAWDGFGGKMKDLMGMLPK